MAYEWSYSWWPVVSTYNATDIVQDAELETPVTTGPTAPPTTGSPPPDWTPPAPSTIPPGEILPPPLPPPTVPFPGTSPVYRYGASRITVVGFGHIGSPDVIECPLVPSIPEDLETTLCEVLTDYSATGAISPITAALEGPEVTSSLGPVYYTVRVSIGLGEADEASTIGCFGEGWTILDSPCAPPDWGAIVNAMDVDGGTGVWYDQPDDEDGSGHWTTPTLHQTKYSLWPVAGHVGNWAGETVVYFDGYMVNPTPHPEVVQHRDAEGFLYRPTVGGSIPHTSLYEVPYDCFFTWDELLLLPDVVVNSSSRSHHAPGGGMAVYVAVWEPDPIQPELPPEPPPRTPSTVVASLGPEGAVLPRRPAPGG